MSTIIQRIEVEWSKESRGAPQAAIRNAVPETYLLGKCSFESGYYCQSIKYSEHDEFVNPIVKPIKQINEQELREMKLVCVEEGNLISVLSWGIPLRKDYGKEKSIGVLKKNTWLRIVGNVRTSSEVTWMYHKFVFNIFHGESEVFDKTIGSCKPIANYIDEADLW